MCMENIDKGKFGWVNPVLVQVQRSHVSLRRLTLTHRNLRFLLSPSRCDCPQRPSGELGPPKPSRVNSWNTAGPNVTAAQSKWRKCDYPPGGDGQTCATLRLALQRWSFPDVCSQTCTADRCWRSYSTLSVKTRPERDKEAASLQRKHKLIRYAALLLRQRG